MSRIKTYNETPGLVIQLLDLKRDYEVYLYFRVVVYRCITNKR